MFQLEKHQHNFYNNEGDFSFHLGLSNNLEIDLRGRSRIGIARSAFVKKILY